MYIDHETTTQSSMRIRTKTLDTCKYLGYTVRKKLKFCGYELILAINKASKIFLLAWIFGAEWYFSTRVLNHILKIW